MFQKVRMQLHVAYIKKTLREYRVNSHKVGLRPPCAELGTEI